MTYRHARRPARPSARTSTGAIEAAPSESNAVLCRGCPWPRKTFGTKSCRRPASISQCEKAEILGVLGPNGAGKTTMLQMLATLLPIDSGERQDLRLRRPPSAAQVRR